jgi:hypothetical protein
MEFLKENRNIIILVALIVIGYLLFQTNTIKNLMMSLSIKWNQLSNFMKLVVILIIIAICYYLYNNSE